MDRSFKESHQGVDLVSMFAPVTKWSALAADAARGTRDGPQGVQARPDRAAGRGLPGCAGGHRAGPGARASRCRRTCRGRRAVPGQVERAAALLRAAARPMVLAGHGAARAGAGAALRRFAETLGIPVATTFHGKGVFPDDHPLALGAWGSCATTTSTSASTNADVDHRGRLRAAGVRPRPDQPGRRQEDHPRAPVSRRGRRALRRRRRAASDISRSLDALAEAAAGPTASTRPRAGRIRALLADEFARGQRDDRFPVAPARIVAEPGQRWAARTSCWWTPAR